MDIYKAFKKYKLKIKGEQIYDPIREKFVHLTPEEKVRQQTLQYMINELEIPPEKIGVEISLNSLGDVGNRKRIDICVFDNDKKVVAIVECKANYIGYKEAPYNQAIDYVTSLGVYRYFVVDGYDMIGYYYNSQQDQFEKIEALPHYQEMLTA